MVVAKRLAYIVNYHVLRLGATLPEQIGSLNEKNADPEIVDARSQLKPLKHILVMACKHRPTQPALKRAKNPNLWHPALNPQVLQSTILPRHVVKDSQLDTTGRW